MDILKTITRDELLQLVEISSSLSDLQRRLYKTNKAYGGRHNRIKLKLKELNIDASELEFRRSDASRRAITNFKKIPNSEVFKENSNYLNNHSIKNRLRRDYDWDFKCAECGINETYNGKPITLQLDHINGINNDNRLDNLRLLYPNCHSQTPTYSGRNQIKHKGFCIDCGATTKTKKSKRCCDCSREHNANKFRKVNISKQEMIELLIQNKGNLSKVGEIVGVSDNSIKKFCIKESIEWKLYKKRN